MSSKDLGNQPAHPFAQTSESYQITGTQHVGMTKREQAAIAAMQGLAANPKHSDLLAEEVAGYATQYADALFAELGKAGAK